MTKEQYIELVQEFVSGSAITADQKKSFHPAIIEKYVDFAIKEAINIYVRESEVTKDFSWLDRHAKWYDISLKSECGVFEGDIPEGVLLLDSHRGIRYLGGDKTLNSPYSPISSGRASAIFSDLDVAFADPNPSFYITGEKINVVGISVDKCYLFAVTSFTKLEDYEEVVFPKSNDRAVWQLVTEKIMQNAQVPSETYNDGKPDRS
jgi:hypothetical protein